MGKYLLKIKLLSDMCVSDGGVYNSALDMDVCHDELGFPYIPAKRLKGCLRECAIELKDMGYDISEKELFGNKGNEKSKVRIGNAYISDYSVKKETVLSHKDAMIFHPQNILNHYSYIRMQTSINYETGVAEDHNLRSMRVINKGLEFLAEVELEEHMILPFQQCCRMLTHMGMARTRGLGEVKVSLEEASEQKREVESQETVTAENYQDNTQMLTYEIYLEEPMICKSIQGGEAKTLDYIEGSKMLGLFAQQLKEKGEDFLSFMEDGQLICSNAYISHKGSRCTEVPAYLYSIKNNKVKCINKLCQEETDEQLNAMKHCYVTKTSDNKLVRKNVEIEERYHHSRPEDKSIGRALGGENEDSKLYQMQSICEGQAFQGCVKGSEHQIAWIRKLLKENSMYYLGYARTSEYGKVRIKEVAPEAKDAKWDAVTDFVVKLDAPAIVYNEKAFYSTDVKDLVAEINTLLGLPENMNPVQKYINYTQVGGFNVTWQMRKPIVTAFDKGTALLYHFSQPQQLQLPQNNVLGERITEGFGEFSIEIVDYMESEISYASKEIEDKPKCVDVSKDGFALEIANSLYQVYIKDAARKIEGVKFSAAGLNSVVATLNQMCREFSTVDEIKKNTTSRFGEKTEKKAKKLECANAIFKACENIKTIEGFEETYNVTGFVCKNAEEMEKRFLEACLMELKYRLREKKLGGKHE